MPAAGVTGAEQFITTRMALRALPFRPDISIYMPTPQSGLNAWLATEGQDETPPYWAYAWGGGAALALHLRDHPETVAGKTVLDFGAGSGLVGIAAAKADAAKIWTMDSDPLAQTAQALNAKANDCALLPWTGDGMPEVDVILAGDVFYSPEVVAKTLPLLLQAASKGTRVLVGDPFRRDLPLSHLELLAEYAVADMGGTEPVRSGVFRLR